MNTGHISELLHEDKHYSMYDMQLCRSLDSFRSPENVFIRLSHNAVLFQNNNQLKIFANVTCKNVYISWYLICTLF